jgi:hypothetical protein
LYAGRAFILQRVLQEVGVSPTLHASRAAVDSDTADGSAKEMIIWFSPYVGMIKRQILEFQLDLKVAELK